MSSFLSLCKKEAYGKCWTQRESQRWLSTSMIKEAWSTDLLMGGGVDSSLQLLHWAAGSIAGCFPSPVCQGPSFLVTIQISPLFSFHCKLNRKVSMLQTLYMESSELSWDAQHSGKAFLQELLIWFSLMWLLGHHPYRPVLTRWVQLAGLFWRCAHGSALAQTIFSPITPFLTLCLTTGIMVCSCRISLFHSNSQQFEAVA